MELKDIKELIRFIDKSNLTEFEYENDNERIYLSKSTGDIVAMPATTVVQQPAVPVSVPAEQEKVTSSDEGIAITSPIVGTFYESSSPDAAPFVKAGDIVSKGQTLCIVEAMKIMNEIEAEFDCKIVKVLVVNAKPVEFGEAIFTVEAV